MEATDYEVIIIGAGIIGSAVAYYLSKDLGDKVLLLEQYDFLHRKGSSHGDSRVIRYTHVQDHYTELMIDAYKLWNEAEKASDTKVYTETGRLAFGCEGNPSIAKLLDGAKKFNIEHQVFHDSEQFAKKFPMLKLQPGHLAMYSPSAGIINATKAVSMFQNLARSNGCKLIDNNPITNVKKKGKIVVVETGNGRKFHTRKCILTCGPWAKKMLKHVANLDLPLETVQVTVAYWKVEQPELYSSKTFPVIFKYDEPKIYGLPTHEFTNLIKVCGFGGPKLDPDERTFEPDYETLQKIVSPWLQQVYTGVSKKPVICETCICTDTPDENFIIDQVPGFPEGSLFVACGFSGHGFKLSPVVGNFLASWILTGKFPLSSKFQNIFSLKRFEES